MALRYLDPVVVKDWEAVCETRSPNERKGFAGMAGSWGLFRVIFNEKTAELFDGVEAGDVNDIHQPGQSEPALTLAVARTDGGWFLEDVPDRKTP